MHFSNFGEVYTDELATASVILPTYNMALAHCAMCIDTNTSGKKVRNNETIDVFHLSEQAFPPNARSSVTAKTSILLLEHAAVRVT
ncbi:hypothetical protein E4U58_001426 [Claviceps cyperi]|nr:hypothetical protein E4U58_001426 [Claviceps cyperi]